MTSSTSDADTVALDGSQTHAPSSPVVVRVADFGLARSTTLESASFSSFAEPSTSRSSGMTTSSESLTRVACVASCPTERAPSSA